MPNLRDLSDYQYRQKLAREYSHPSSGYVPTKQEIDEAIAVGTGRKPQDIAYGEQGLQAPAVAGGLVSLDPTDYLSGAGLAKIAAMAKVGGIGLASLAGGMTAMHKMGAQSVPRMFGQAGMFAGRGAKTANLAMLAKAEEMAKAGIPDSQIWKETGWTLDTPDKMPRFEIPDNSAIMSSKALPTEYIESIGKHEPSWKVGQVLDHPDLYSAYPNTRDIQSSFMYGQNADAEYKSGMDWISYNAERMKKSVPSIEQQKIIDAARAEREAFYARPDVKAWNEAQDNFDFNQPNMEEAFRAMSAKHGGAELDKEASRLAKNALNERNFSGQGYGLKNAKSITLHELQHAIQQREGFASGGSPDSLRQLVKIDNMMQGKPAPTDADVYDAYQRLAGEAEARLTQARMNLTPEERLAQYPYDPEYFKGATGVNLNDLIVRKDGGTAMSIPESNIPELMSEAEKAMLRYELSKIPAKPAVSLRDLAIGGGALGAGGLAGYYGIGAME